MNPEEIIKQLMMFNPVTAIPRGVEMFDQNVVQPVKQNVVDPVAQAIMQLMGGQQQPPQMPPGQMPNPNLKQRMMGR